MKTFLLILAGIALACLVLFVLPFPVHSQVASITLDWTSSGDDGVVGTASTYEMRWATTRPDTTSSTSMDSWWATATIVPSMPTPLISGTSQSKQVTGPFLSGATYYFVMKACDEVPLCSPYSNVASKFIPDTIPPSRIIDLRTR